MGKVVAAAAYREGCKIADIALSDGRAWAERPDHFVWIGLHEPSEVELKDLQRQFGLHELAVEDALKAHQRSKVELYGDMIFLAFHTVQRGADGVMFGESCIFAARGFVISIRHGPSASYASVRAKLEAAPRLLRHGEDFVLHGIMDFVVDNYAPVLEAIESDILSLEENFLGQPLTQRDITRLYELRRELRAIKRAVTPMAQIIRQLQQLDFALIDKAIRPYFRDVADHAQKTAEQVDALGELLDHTFEAGFLMEQSRQNGIQRRFAAWAAILAVPTAIAGIYGMNFDNMPELRWENGYYIVVGIIASLCSGLFIFFRRSGWL